MILEKNPDYWDKDKIYFDRITLKPLPTRSRALPACNRARST